MFLEVKEALEEEGYKINKGGGFFNISWENIKEEKEHTLKVQKERDIKNLKEIIKRWGEDIYAIFEKIQKQ